MIDFLLFDSLFCYSILCLTNNWNPLTHFFITVWFTYSFMLLLYLTSFHYMIHNLIITYIILFHLKLFYFILFHFYQFAIQMFVFDFFLFFSSIGVGASVSSCKMQFPQLLEQISQVLTFMWSEVFCGNTEVRTLSKTPYFSFLEFLDYF